MSALFTYILIGTAIVIGVFILALHLNGRRNKTVETDEDGDNIDGGV